MLCLTVGLAASWAFAETRQSPQAASAEAKLDTPRVDSVRTQSTKPTEAGPAIVSATEAASITATEPASAPATEVEVEAVSTKVPSTDVAPPTTTLPGPVPPDAHQKVETRTPSLLTAVGAPEKALWEKANGGLTLSRLVLGHRVTERPPQLLTNPRSLPKDPTEFLHRVARDTWRGLRAYTDRTNGLAMDNVRVIGNLVTPITPRIGDYTNITNVGLQLASIVAATRLGLFSEADARAATALILETLAGLRKHNGYFFNYYDTTTLEATSNFLSFVDTGWLVAGLMISRQAFPDLAKPINEILAPIDFQWFYNEATGMMSHGYFVNRGSRSTFEYSTFYTEARLGSLIAIGKGDVPPSHWYAMRRALQPPCGDAECPSQHRLVYSGPDNTKKRSSYYRWQSFNYVPSWGGSMFEALMPRLMIDEGRWAPRSLGANGVAHATVQRVYAEEVLGSSIWGMSPCMNPDGGRYREFGIRILGAHGYAEKVVTPHATALALAVTPEEATKALMELANNYDIYGPFGFYDSVEVATGRVAYDQLALDQTMLFLALANHLGGEVVTEHFTADPWIQHVLPLLAAERFFP